MLRTTAIALFMALLVAASGCGGGSASPTPPTPSAISVQISPVTATVFQGATQLFTATVSGTTNTAVAWSVQEGALGGTITAAGSYRAPTNAGTFHVIATSQADTSKIAIATITVPGPSVAIAPVSVTLAPSGTQAFTATVTGLVNTAVTWTVQEAAGGAVSGTGFYTAPITTGFYHVVATSVADATVSGSATITVTTSAARFTSTGDMVNARGFHTATLLADGRVLVAGGGTRSGPICINGISSAELYDSGTGSFVTTGTMTNPRYNHTATLLLNEQVLVIGGLGSTTDCEDLGTPVLSSAELYNPSTDSFKATGSMAKARSGHTATLLANGKVLIVGGTDESFVAGVKTAELYDALTSMFSSTGSVSTARSGHTATLLANGKVLITGGIDRTNPNSPAATSKAELYDPATGTFTPTNNMTVARDGHTATLLATGRVLIAGGADLPSAEVYDPATGSFSPTGDMGQARTSHTATLLSNGTVLMAGGSDSTAELYDLFTGSFSPTGGMEIARGGHTATLLQNGKVLISGGVQGRSFLATAELYK
jgi:WD40 repeat protein